MTLRALIGLLILFLSATPSLRADMVIQISVGGDLIALPHKTTRQGSCQPCVDPVRPGDSVTLFAAVDRIRRDRGPISIILKKDVKKIFFVCQTTKQYVELSYPVKAKWLKPKLPLPIEDNLRQYGLTAPGTTGRSQLKQWQVETFDAKVVNGLRQQYRLHLAVADLGGASGALVMEFTKLLNELQHEGHGWSQLLPFDHGVAVVWEEAQRQPETEFVYKEEVTEVKEQQVPPEFYDVPAGFRKIRFNPDCARFR